MNNIGINDLNMKIAMLKDNIYDLNTELKILNYKLKCIENKAVKNCYPEIVDIIRSKVVYWEEK